MKNLKDFLMKSLPNLMLIKDFNYLIIGKLETEHYSFFKCFECFCIKKLYLKLALDCI